MKKGKNRSRLGPVFFEKDMPSGGLAAGEPFPGRPEGLLSPLATDSRKKATPRPWRGVVFCFMVLLQSGCVQSIRGDGYAFL